MNLYSCLSIGLLISAAWITVWLEVVHVCTLQWVFRYALSCLIWLSNHWFLGINLVMHCVTCYFFSDKIDFFVDVIMSEWQMLEPFLLGYEIGCPFWQDLSRSTSIWSFMCWNHSGWKLWEILLLRESSPGLTHSTHISWVYPCLQASNILCLILGDMAMFINNGTME